MNRIYVRNSSCNQGWLRMAIQTTFAIITVASFIMILIMAVQIPSRGEPPNDRSRCQINNCRVICEDAPYFEEYEEDIINAIMIAENKCRRISLVLNNPTFINSTLPPNWLSNLRINIHDFSIIRGNLMHIAPGAFMNHFTGNIRRLQFTGVTIKTWEEESLVGLFRLDELSLNDCNIIKFQADALRAVDDTLETLSITKSNYWSPLNVTGISDFTKLALVDFSFNYFNNILSRGSFVGLKNCKILYLHSCRITAIGAGTFDYLQKIEVIFLNDNLLMTIPTGLFDNIILLNPKPRINLLGNFWLCDCSSTELLMLSSNDLLLFDPVCHYPEHIRGSTFSNFKSDCNNKHQLITKSNQIYMVEHESSYDYIYVNGTCCDNSVYSVNTSYRLHSPILEFKCFFNETNNLDQLSVSDHKMNRVNRLSSNWLMLNFFLETGEYSVIQIDSSVTSRFGVIWFHSKCPNEIYCVQVVPKFLRLYNVEIDSRYTFCPFKADTGLIDVEDCIGYDISSMAMVKTKIVFTIPIVLYIATGLICLICGALCVYWIIRKNPSLLKGNKRIVFVKHKMVDALVLPPKIPIRSSLTNEINSDVDNKTIFMLSGSNPKNSNLFPNKYHTQKSVKSNTSGTPSYISALQPTEDQLAEWRINTHFNNDLTITSNSDLSALTWIFKSDSVQHTEEVDNSKVYHSL